MQDLLSLATETTLTIISCLNPLIRLQPVRHEIAQKYGITQCFLVLYLLLLAPSAVGTIPSWTYRYRSRRPRTDLEAHLRRVQVPKFYKYHRRCAFVWGFHAVVLCRNAFRYQPIR
jgi:hypothetical protein